MRKPNKTCQNNKNVPKIAILSLILSMIFIIRKYRDIAHFGRMARTLTEHILRTEFARDKRKKAAVLYRSLLENEPKLFFDPKKWSDPPLP